MPFPISPPIKPMLAKLARAIPTKGRWHFEPKWDGFRVLVFRDGDELYLQSRDSKPLLRYFPELYGPLCAQLPERCVVDGELVIAGAKGLDFGALQLRLHPAKSRIDMLAEQSPARVVLWDLLAVGDEDLMGEPLSARRARLEELLRGAVPPVHVTPATSDPAVAADWFARFEGAGLDGVIAKDPDGVYLPGKRAMVKVKHQRTIDCAVAGFRWHKHGPGTEVGSLVLGLFDGDGRMHQVGIAASFSKVRRGELATQLEPLREGALDGHPWAEWAGAQERRPGMASRWNRGKDLSWEPVRLELVAEVSYNHAHAGHFRHPAKFVRFRPDKQPRDCGFEQLEVVPAVELEHVFGS